MRGETGGIDGPLLERMSRQTFLWPKFRSRGIFNDSSSRVMKSTVASFPGQKVAKAIGDGLIPGKKGAGGGRNDGGERRELGAKKEGLRTTGREREHQGWISAGGSERRER
jgi:hypothetical protein